MANGAGRSSEDKNQVKREWLKSDLLKGSQRRWHFVEWAGREERASKNSKFGNAVRLCVCRGVGGRGGQGHLYSLPWKVSKWRLGSSQLSQMDDRSFGHGTAHKSQSCECFQIKWSSSARRSCLWPMVCPNYPNVFGQVTSLLPWVSGLFIFRMTEPRSVEAQDDLLDRASCPD